MADKPMCREKVPGHKGGLRTWPCQNYGKVQVDGKWYCGIHDPEKVKQKEALRQSTMKAKILEMNRQRRIAKLKEEVVEAAKLWYVDDSDAGLWKAMCALITAEKECEG